MIGIRECVLTKGILHLRENGILAYLLSIPARLLTDGIRVHLIVIPACLLTKGIRTCILVNGSQACLLASSMRMGAVAQLLDNLGEISQRH